MTLSCKYQENTINLSIISLMVYLFLNSLTFAGSFITVSGIIIDGESNEPLIGASISRQHPTTGVISDYEGKFTLTLSEPDTIEISYVGFASQKYYISSDLFLNVKMNSEVLEEVVITAKSENKPTVSGLSTISLPKATIEQLPQIMGEYEVLRAIQTLPGVISSNDGDRGIFIRGGSTDQTLMLLDNMPVYNASHLYGFLSVFNSDIIEETQVYKNYLPPRYGGRLAAAVNVTTDIEQKSGWHGSVRVGTFTSGGSFSGTISKKVNIFGSLRGSYAGTYLRPLSKMQFASSDGSDGGEIGYYFYDASIGLNVDINKNNLLKIRGFYSQDRFQYIDFYGDYSSSNILINYEKNDKNVLWRNQMCTASLESQLPKQWHLTTVVGNSYYALNSYKYNYYDYTNSAGKYINTYTHDSERSYLMDFIVQFNLKKLLKNNTVLYTGMWNTVKPIHIMNKNRSTSSGKTTYYTFPNYIQYENLHFAEIDKIFSNKTRLNVGLRNTLLYSDHTIYYNVEPRIYATLPIPHGNIHLTTQYTAQNIHMLTSSTADILNDLWLPVTSNYRPQNAYIAETGIRQEYKNFSYEVSAYYRKMWHLVDFTGTQSYLEPKLSLEEQITSDVKGTAYGIEASIQYTYKLLDIKARYNFTHSRRVSPDINQGTPYAFKYERPNDFNINFSLKLGKKWSFHTAWTYTNGNNISLPNSEYASAYTSYAIDFYSNTTPLASVNQNYIKYYTGKNDYRLPANHHWDLSFVCKKNRPKIKQEFNISIYNIYNRMNIFTVYYEYPSSGKNRQNQYKKVTLMPIMPFFSYAIKF